MLKEELSLTVIASVAAFPDSSEGQRLHRQLHDDVIAANRSGRGVLNQRKGVGGFRNGFLETQVLNQIIILKARHQNQLHTASSFSIHVAIK